MLPSETEFKETGTLKGDSIDMTFDENSLGFLANVLIDLYSDKEYAAIREYATNALDSHKVAGQKRPIEVTTPSYFSYMFKIKDYGIGLSKDDIRDIYSKYGASTKRGSNEQTGMLGLGCKSALTYTDQFNLIAVKDGIKINVSISRAESGGGKITIVSETETDEPNGVEIIIPVKKNNKFESKCKEFFKYWPVDTVLVNEKPAYRQELKKITDRIYLRDDAGWNDRPVLVMGGVSYEIDLNQITLPKSLVAFVDIGSVSFTPNREQLHYTEKTKRTLNELASEYRVNVLKSVQTELDAALTKYHGVKVISDWSWRLRSEGISISASDFTYNGKQFQTDFEFHGHWEFGEKFYCRGKSNYSIGQSLDRLRACVIVKDFDTDRLTPWQKKKLIYWADENGKGNNFYFCKTVPGNGWLDDITTVSWDDIVAIKLPKAGQGTKTVPTYEINYQNKTVTTSDIDKTKPIWYSTKTKWSEMMNHFYHPQKWFEDVQFVFIGKNRIAKFTATYPTAVELKDGMTQYVQGYIDDLTDEEKKLLNSNTYEQSKYRDLKAGSLLDPELRQLIELSSKVDQIAKLRTKWEEMSRIACAVGLQKEVNGLSQSSTPLWLTTRYPLFETLVHNKPYRASVEYYNDVYLYCNTVYETRVKGVK